MQVICNFKNFQGNVILSYMEVMGLAVIYFFSFCLEVKVLIVMMIYISATLSIMMIIILAYLIIWAQLLKASLT